MLMGVVNHGEYAPISITIYKYRITVVMDIILVSAVLAIDD